MQQVCNAVPRTFLTIIHRVAQRNKWHLKEVKTIQQETAQILAGLGVAREAFEGGALEVRTPITGETIGHVRTASPNGTKEAIQTADAAFHEWRKVPAPKRGELVRLLGEELRAEKTELGRLVTIEAGKIVSEGLGEVQEMIDICTLPPDCRGSSAA